MDRPGSPPRPGRALRATLAEYPAGPILTSLPGVGIRTGVTMLIEITDIGRSATQGRSPFTPGSHLAHIALERPSKVSIDNTAATPDSNAPSIFQRSLLSRIRSPVPTTTENELRAGVAGARLEVRVRAPDIVSERTPMWLQR